MSDRTLGTMSTVSWSEVQQRSLARVDVADLREDVEALRLEIVPVTVEDADQIEGLTGVLG